MMMPLGVLPKLACLYRHKIIENGKQHSQEYNYTTSTVPSNTFAIFYRAEEQTAGEGVHKD